MIIALELRYCLARPLRAEASYLWQHEIGITRSKIAPSLPKSNWREFVG